ncbi:Zinc finger protein [Trichinella pseudospiralis]
MATNQLENKRLSGAVLSMLAETSRHDNQAAAHRSRRLSASRKPKAEQTSTQRKSRSASRTSNSLLVEYTKMEQRRSRPRPSIFRRPTHLYKPARPWACRVCGYILETVFAITAGICFVVTGIASLIATKRLDKGTITILLLFSIVSLILSLIIVIESSTSINYLCHKGSCAEHEATRSIFARLC